MGSNIAAVVLAAGGSRRMGRPKLLLPWGDTTVLGQVLETLIKAQVDELVVVTGEYREQVEAFLREETRFQAVRTIHNPRREDGMMSSIYTGLAALATGCDAALITLGDHPQLKPETVLDIVNAFNQTKADLVLPSFMGRRGHPWLVSRRIWKDLTAFPVTATARDFMRSYSNKIHYIDADASIMVDLDTPEDYANFRP